MEQSPNPTAQASANTMRALEIISIAATALGFVSGWISQIFLTASEAPPPIVCLCRLITLIFPVASLVLAIIAFLKRHKTQTSKVLAIIALSLSGVYWILFLIGVLIGFCKQQHLL